MRMHANLVWDLMEAEAIMKKYQRKWEIRMDQRVSLGQQCTTQSMVGSDYRLLTGH